MSNWKYYDPREMTPQEIIDASVTHVINQGKPCVDNNGTCVYRRHDGFQCAASIFISDGEYKEKWDVDILGVTFFDVIKTVENPPEAKKIKIIGKLQAMHDAIAELAVSDAEFIEMYKRHCIDAIPEIGYTVPSIVYE